MKHTKRVVCFDSLTARYFYAESINQIKWFVDKLNNYIADFAKNIDLRSYFEELTAEFGVPMPLIIDERLFTSNVFVDLPVISKVTIKKIVSEQNSKAVYVLNLVGA